MAGDLCLSWRCMHTCSICMTQLFVEYVIKKGLS